VAGLPALVAAMYSGNATGRRTVVAPGAQAGVQVARTPSLNIVPASADPRGLRASGAKWHRGEGQKDDLAPTNPLAGTGWHCQLPEQCAFSGILETIMRKSRESIGTCTRLALLDRAKLTRIHSRSTFKRGADPALGYSYA
jgi:hypothetical protein